ncbi:MAG: 16S rRNA (cytosine(1402)-N(4))-methyltransferase RsmH [Oscillospiraceae bacterium]|nr:16S rRNA (cytosine(1402)-N(4))-methyltransferase RsmH [Oscillospiraceae bacterium]
MEHLPVLLDECIEGLKIKPSGTYVDGTLGRGGHSGQIAKKLSSGKLVAIDRDADALEEASVLLSDYKDKIVFLHGNFSDISALLASSGYNNVDGILFDFGVSSPQLDNGDRGFSYMQDAPLDMRMDRSCGESAYDAVNNWPQEKLRKVFSEYGEERYAGSIARAIVKKRESHSIKTTFDLNNIIFSAIPASARREPQHPSKRCFQALRIAINDELSSISEMLQQVTKLLNSGGRICAISFHSLEDRLVKSFFASQVSGCTCPGDFPVCICGFAPTLKLITKKPITPGNDELHKNPRSRSAKLRIAERI